MGGGCYPVCAKLAEQLRWGGQQVVVEAVSVDISDESGRSDVLTEALRARIRADEWPGATSRWPAHPMGWAGHCVLTVDGRWLVDPTLGQFSDQSQPHRSGNVTVPDELIEPLPADWATRGELVVRTRRALIIYSRLPGAPLPPYLERY